MSLLRARFDECQSVAGIGATHKGRPLSEHAKRQESVDLRHPQCSLKSVESASHRKVISIIEERGKSEELESSRCFTRRAPRSSSAVLQHQPGSGSQLHTQIALSKQSDRDQSTS